MKHMIPLLSFIVLFSTYITKGMEKEIHFPGQLNEIEKLIVWRKIKKIGKPMVLSMTESTNLPTATHIRKNSTDRCDIFIINTIKEQEKEHGYVPEQINKKHDGVWHITIPTNYIGNYTRYWHKQDTEGEYIELYSNFTDKQALLEVIHNCNLYFACNY